MKSISLRFVSLAFACLLALSASSRAIGADDMTTANAWLAKNAKTLPASVVQGAAKEGSITLYCLVSACPQKLLDSFGAAFPFLKVDVYRATGGALYERLNSEATASRGVADIVMSASPAAGDLLVTHKILQTWTPPTAGLVPPEWTRPGLWYGIGVYHAAIGWNTEKVTPQEEAMLEKITSWDQIEFPLMKGKTVIGDPRSGPFLQLLYYFMRDKYGEQSWQKLKALDPVALEGNDPAEERVVAGEYAYTPMINDVARLTNQYQRGAPVRWAYPSPLIALPYFVGISTLSPHPNAAKLFETWAASIDGQTAWVNYAGLAPMRKDIVDNRPVAKAPWYKLPKTTYQPDWQKVFTSADGVMSDFRKEFNR